MNTTQGEHAQTALEDFEVRKLAAIGAVSTSSGLIERRPIEYRRELENQFVRGYRAAESRLHAQVAALTAAPVVQSNTKTHALLSTMIGLFLRAKEKIGYQPGSAIDKTVAEAVEHLKDWPYPETAAHQGVAYAELPDDFPKTVAELEFLLDVARNCGQHMERADRLAASNGQAPAGAVLFDEQGFQDWVLRNLPDDTIIGNSAWWADHLTAWAKRFVTAPPAAQATPAADYDHSPQSLTVAEAARHVGKWLNERPNRPLDLRDVAMLCAHAQKAPAAGAVAGPTVRKVFLVATGEEHEGEATYTRYDDAPPPLCDSECLYTAAPTPAAQADSVLEDAARWNEVLNHVGADNLLGGAQYVLRGIQAPMNVMQGSVAQHFTKSIDAARKQGGKHDNH